MAIEKVKEYFKRYGMEERILEFDVSSATVELAATALHCEPQRIAKTLSFMVDSHAVGGVCPFAVNEGVDVYLDISLKRFETVFNSAIKLTITELEEYSGYIGWVDVCKGY